ncbi:MAG: exopolyphosphatase, partial [Actinobacteria bacterium]|nr:exopolyphosphatase [Actinomycetota bacterium]
MTRVAAIDCGTNSIRLLIADVDSRNFREIYRTMEIVRLGQGVDKNKE